MLRPRRSEPVRWCAFADCDLYVGDCAYEDPDTGDVVCEDCADDYCAMLGIERDELEPIEIEGPAAMWPDEEDAAVEDAMLRRLEAARA